MMELGWILQRSPDHTLLQKQMELMKAVCLDPFSMLHAFSPSLFSLLPCPRHTHRIHFQCLTSPDRLTVQLLQPHPAHCAIYKLFQQCLIPS